MHSPAREPAADNAAADNAGGGVRLLRPPRLRTDAPQASASRLELFFDLAYVLVVAELATELAHNPDWGHLGVFAGLFTAMWMSWVSFTLYANRFDTDDVVFRIAVLTATLGVAGCAASASGAADDLATPFAVSYTLTRLVLLGLYVRAWRHVPDARPTINLYLATTALSAGCWMTSVFVTGPAQYVLWAVGVAVGAVGPVLATVVDNAAPIHVEHLPERFGLLVILVLGEAVAAAVTAVHDAHWQTLTVVSAVSGFVAAAAAWWIYFDTAAARSEKALQAADDEPDKDSDERHDAFIFGHLPLTGGIVLLGVGLEDLALHPHTPNPSAAGWLLALGLVAFLAGGVAIVAGSTRQWARSWPLPVAVAVAVTALMAAPLPSWTAVTSLAVLLTALAVITTRNRAPSNGK